MILITKCSSLVVVFWVTVIFTWWPWKIDKDRKIMTQKIGVRFFYGAVTFTRPKNWNYVIRRHCDSWMMNYTQTKKLVQERLLYLIQYEAHRWHISSIKTKCAYFFENKNFCETHRGSDYSVLLHFYNKKMFEKISISLLMLKCASKLNKKVIVDKYELPSVKFSGFLSWSYVI